MSLHFVTEERPHDVDTDSPATLFASLQSHYDEARFIYPAKRERLAQAWPLIEVGWPALLKAPADIFQLHVAYAGGRIVSSLCAYRDTAETYVIQHAASVRVLRYGLMNCILDCLSTINDDPSFRVARMYFRPDNAWPSRVSASIRDALPDSRLGAESLEAYLVCEPSTAIINRMHEAGEHGPVALGQTLSVRDVDVTDPSETRAVVEFVVRVRGTLRALALGCDPEKERPDLGLWDLNRRYLSFGLRRTRRVLAAYRNDTLIGLAFCHASSIPINYSFLCGRTEVIPDSTLNEGERAEVVKVLARASIAVAALRGDPVAALMVDPIDSAAAISAGYSDTGKQYASFMWGRESANGTPSSLLGIRRLYHAVD
jgi:hypothetical protein